MNLTILGVPNGFVSREPGASGCKFLQFRAAVDFKLGAQHKVGQSGFKHMFFSPLLGEMIPTD